MNDAAAFIGIEQIVIEDVFSHPREKVWRALTDGALIRRWMPMEPSGFDAVEGTKFTFQTTPAGEWDGTIQCEVLAVAPGTRLAFSWKGGHPSNRGYGAPLDTVVTFDLSEAGDGTRVRLVHSGFVLPRNETAFTGMSKGWPGVVRHLAEASSL
jgi:uncharacterized protein YndB with AHSA1/START domain